MQPLRAAETSAGASPGGGVSGILANKYSVDSYYKFELAFRYLEPRAVTKMRNTFYSRMDYTFNRRLQMRMAAWAYYDLAYDFFNYDTISARFERDAKDPLVFVEQLPNDKDSEVAELRELYADIFFESVDIRLGLQHVVWGVLEGVRVVDEINPMNFRELILPDSILDYRIPLWTAKMDWYSPIGDWQFLLIPHVRFHEPAPAGSEWELFQDVPGTIEPEAENPRNWEIGLRWSNNIFDTDVSLSYFYTWDDFPVIFRHITNIGDNPEPTLFPTYTRLNIFGTTFSRQLFGMIVKGEMAYITGKYFGIEQEQINRGLFLEANGEFQKDHLRWGLGLDVHLWGWDFSPAYVAVDILDYDPRILQPSVDRSFNFYARKHIRRWNAMFTLLWINLISMEESYLKPRLNFRVTDKYRMAVGLDIFTGQPSSFGVATRSPGGGGPLPQPTTLEQHAQFFGNFDNNDRIVVEMRYAF